MENKIRIQCIGRMHSGKDSLWKIANENNPQVKRIAQADILKDVCQDTMKIAYDVMKDYGFNLDFYDFQRMMEQKQYTRRFLIDFGTGVMRNKVKDSIWLDACVEKNLDVIETGEYVNTDIRFMDEFLKFNELGAVTVRIICQKEILWKRYKQHNPNTERSLWEEFYQGETESLVDNPDIVNNHGHYTISNNGTYDEFCFKVGALVANIKSGYRG